MDAKLNIAGIFTSEANLAETILKRKICYDIEPYYNTTKQGQLLQIGYQSIFMARSPSLIKNLLLMTRNFAGS